MQSKINITLGMLIIMVEGCFGNIKDIEINKACKVMTEAAKKLFEASEEGEIEVVKELIKAGVDVNESGEYGLTALMEASRNGHLEVVRELIKAGADVKGMYRALVYACEKGHVEIVRELINAGANPKDSVYNKALMCASVMGHVEVVRELLKAGVEVNVKSINNGETALMQASKYGHLEVVRELLGAKATWCTSGVAMGLLKEGVDSISGELTRLFYKSMGHLLERDAQGRTGIGKELLLLGGDLITSSCKMLVRLPAGTVRTVGELVKAEIDVNARNKDGYTALGLARKSNEIAIVYQLIGGGADEEQGFLDALVTDEEAELTYTGAKHKSVPIETLRKYCGYIAERESVKQQVEIDTIVQKYFTEQNLGELVCDIISNMSEEEGGLNIDIKLLRALYDYIGYLNRQNAIMLIGQKREKAEGSPISIIDPLTIRCILSLTKTSKQEIVNGLIKLKEEWLKSKRNLMELKGMKCELVMSALFDEKIKVIFYFDGVISPIGL